MNEIPTRADAKSTKLSARAARIQCDEVLIELGLGRDATVIVRKPGSTGG
jgi:hypothetical protein